jgi:hypothetical protein
MSRTQMDIFKNKQDIDKKMAFILIFVGSPSTMTIALTTTTSTIFDNAWAKEKIERTEEDNQLMGSPNDDSIDSKGGDDTNFGDNEIGEGSGDDKIKSGDGDDQNFGDTVFGDGSGDDKINAGAGDDSG